MELPVKTMVEARAFANTLSNVGDHELFLDLFDRGEYATINGHFPAFYGEVAETPAIETETPAIETETPAIETETSAIETETPAIETETSAIETETPAIETETPIETETSAIETETPAIETETSAIETEKLSKPPAMLSASAIETENKNPFYN